MGLKWKLRWSNNAQKAYCDFESSNPTVEKSEKSFSCDFHRKGHICHQTNVTFFKQTVLCARKALQAGVYGEAGETALRQRTLNGVLKQNRMVVSPPRGLSESIGHGKVILTGTVVSTRNHRAVFGNRRDYAEGAILKRAQRCGRVIENHAITSAKDPMRDTCPVRSARGGKRQRPACRRRR